MSFSLRWPENLATEVIPFRSSLTKDLSRQSVDSFAQQPLVKVDSDSLFADLSKSLDHSVLVSALEDLLNNQRTADVEIVVDGRTIYAHSPILKSRSPCFRTMFEGGFQEYLRTELSGGILSVEITDFSYDVVYAFMTYLYTNRMVWSVSAKEIFLVADKYEVIALRDLAEKAIVDSLTLDQVCGQLFAYGHRFPSLRSKMIGFIATNFQQIDRRCDFVDLVQDYKQQMEEADQILVEIMRAMSRNVLCPSTPPKFAASGFSASSSLQSNPAGGFYFGFDIPSKGA